MRAGGAGGLANSAAVVSRRPGDAHVRMTFRQIRFPAATAESGLASADQLVQEKGCGERVLVRSPGSPSSRPVVILQEYCTACLHLLASLLIPNSSEPAPNSIFVRDFPPTIPRPLRGSRHIPSSATEHPSLHIQGEPSRFLLR
jgi:hypothetical protein